MDSLLATGRLPRESPLGASRVAAPLAKAGLGVAAEGGSHLKRALGRWGGRDSGLPPQQGPGLGVPIFVRCGSGRLAGPLGIAVRSETAGPYKKLVVVGRNVSRRRMRLRRVWAHRRRIGPAGPLAAAHPGRAPAAARRRENREERRGLLGGGPPRRTHAPRRPKEKTRWCRQAGKKLPRKKLPGNWIRAAPPLKGNRIAAGRSRPKTGRRRKTS